MQRTIKQSLSALERLMNDGNINEAVRFIGNNRLNERDYRPVVLGAALRLAVSGKLVKIAEADCAFEFTPEEKKVLRPEVIRGLGVALSRLRGTSGSRQISTVARMLSFTQEEVKSAADHARMLIEAQVPEKLSHLESIIRTDSVRASGWSRIAAEWARYEHLPKEMVDSEAIRIMKSLLMECKRDLADEVAVVFGIGDNLKLI